MTTTKFAALSAVALMTIGFSACSSAGKNATADRYPAQNKGALLEDIVLAVKGTPKSETAMLKAYDNYRALPGNSKLGLTPVKNVDEIPARFKNKKNATEDFASFLYTDMKASGSLTATMERAFQGTSTSVEVANTGYKGETPTFTKPGGKTNSATKDLALDAATKSKLKEVDLVAPGTSETATNAYKNLLTLEKNSLLPKGTASKKLNLDTELALVSKQKIMGDCKSITTSPEAVINEIAIQEFALARKPTNIDEVAEGMVAGTQEKLALNKEQACNNLRELCVSCNGEVSCEISARGCK